MKSKKTTSNHGYEPQSKLRGIIPSAARDCEVRRQVDSTYQFHSAAHTELEFHNKSWLVYILRCKDKSYYTGITSDMEKRLAAHMAGTASRYTRARRPVKLLATTRLMSRSDALRLEIKIKKHPKAKKLAVLAAQSKI